MRVGLIVENKQTKNAILSAHTKADVLFKQIGEFDQLKVSEHFEAAARLHIDVLYVSLESIMEENSFVRSLRQYRINRPTTKVVIIAVDKLVGDPTLNSIVNIGIYDIIAPSTEGLEEDEEIDLTHYVSYCLDHPGTYASAARWIVQTEERAPRRSMFPKRESDQEQAKTNLQEQKPKEVIVYQDRILNSVIIALTSGQRRTGTTTAAIKTALHLTKLGYKTACVEFMNEEFNEPVFKHFISDEASVHAPGGFALKGIDFFPNVTLNKLLNLYAANYKYIVVDYGQLLSHVVSTELNQYEREYIRANFHIITAGSAEWDIQHVLLVLDRFYSWEWDQKWHILFNFATEDMLKNFRDIFSKKEIKDLRIQLSYMGFNPDLFTVNDFDKKTLNELLEPVLERKATKKRWLFSIRS